MKRILRVMILATALGMMAVGMIAGGAMDVLNRSAMICLECIGIG